MLQQINLPQGPIPPISFALSLTPTCLSSILVLYIAANFLASYLKSILSSAKKIKINFQTKGQYQIILDFVEKADGGLKDYVLVDAEYAEQKLIDEKVLSEVFALPEIAYTHNYVEHGDSLILTLCYSMPMEVGDGMSVEEQQRVMNAYTDFNLLITLKRV